LEKKEKVTTSQKVPINDSSDEGTMEKRQISSGGRREWEQSQKSIRRRHINGRSGGDPYRFKKESTQENRKKKKRGGLGTERQRRFCKVWGGQQSWGDRKWH